MCDLGAAERCSAALEPLLDQLIAQYPGHVVLVYPEGDKVRMHIARSYADAERFRDSALSREQIQGSIIEELDQQDHVLML